MFDLLSQLLSGAAGQVKTQDPFVNGMLRWVGSLQAAALTRWRAVAASGLRCSGQVHAPAVGLVACPAPAVGACILCGRPTCPDHAMVSSDGELACSLCMGRAVAAAKAGGFAGAGPGQAPPPGVDPRVAIAEKEQQCLHVLGLRPGASWEDIAAAFKRLSRKWHPDLHARKRSADSASTKFKEISAAYTWLKGHRGK